MDRKIVLTADGSHSLYVAALDEHYHSRHGAVQESLHVFMEMGWGAVAKEISPLRILEIGFGTGLNAYLSLLRARAEGRAVAYVAVEAYPLLESEYKHLNYPDQLLQPESSSLLQDMHVQAWGAPFRVDGLFELTKLEDRIEGFPPQAPVHLIYFDAFAPEKQPELWTEGIFARMYAQLLPGGVLVTYCAKGAVKRAMLAAGFRVEKVPGPPGKREMIRAWK